MPKYNNYEYKGDLSKLRDKTYLTQIKAQFDRVQAENDQLYKDVIKKWEQMRVMAVQVYGADSKQHRYIVSNEPVRPKPMSKEYDKLLKRFSVWLEAEKQREKERERNQRRKAVIVLLEEQGYKRGQHFTESNALTFAKKVLVELSPGVFAPRMLPERVKG